MISPKPNKLISRQTGRVRFRAFTLVELLVVIGIIALLISILLPSLIAARQASQRTACGVKLQQIILAATIHASEHKGFYPLAGQLNTTIANQNIDPAGLNDTYCEHYTYMGFAPNGPTSATRFIAPITFALGTEMGFKRNLDAMTDPVQLTADLDNIGVIRNFICPSQGVTPIDIQKLGWLFEGNSPALGGGTGYTEAISYVFNEYVVGYDDAYARLRGQSSRVRQSTKTVFCMDGLAGSTNTRLSGTFTGINGNPPQYAPPPYGMMTVYNNYLVSATENPGAISYAPITLSDALTGRTGGPGNHKLAGDFVNFDPIRHKQKINIAFCDGHVELRELPVYKVNAAGTQITFKNDPAGTNLANDAKNLSDIYIVAP
jgi:prepilin-type processing-associated H-X9-DG protein/prepilin-type N-terminal cleavage/methylation domain-containing protein